jgi:WD40 repeat protein
MIPDFSQEPYPGLRPFRQEETDIFFGREEHTDQLLERLAGHRFLAVTGLSGCGKSSLVRAGLIPALNRGFVAEAGHRWRVVEIRPGRAPFARLASGLLHPAALAPERGGIAGGADFLEETLRRGPMGLVEVLRQTSLPVATNLLVVVDQFEEIFRMRTKDEVLSSREFQKHRQNQIDEADAFVQLLLASKEQQEFSIFILLTMRTDYVGHCAVFRGLLEVINESQYIPPALTRDQLSEAISTPAQVFGGQVEETLCHLLLNDAASSQDQLPLLQHAMMRMWRIAQEGREKEGGPDRVVLTLEHYATVGSVRPSAEGESALSRHGREVLGRLNGESQDRIAELLFRALSGGAAERRDTRRLVRVQEVAEIGKVTPEHVIKVADAFRAPGCNFITAIADEGPSGELRPETQLDISHESLIRHWDKLKDWVDRETRASIEYQHLVGEEQRYSAGHRAELTALELQNALAWKHDFSPNVAWAQRYGGDYEKIEAFLARSDQAVKRQRFNKMLGRLWIAAPFFLALFLALTVWALLERNNAKNQADNAKKFLAKALTYKALSDWQNNNPLSALAYLPQIKAVGAELPPLGKLGGLLPPEIRFHHAIPFSNPLKAVALSSDQRWLATATSDGKVEVIDPMTSDLKTQISGLVGDPRQTTRLAFSPKGEWLAVLAKGQLSFWKYEQKNWIRAKNALDSALTQEKVFTFAVHPSGDLVAVVVAAVDLGKGQGQRQLKFYQEDGTSLTAESPDGTFDPSIFSSLAFSPTGNQIALASDNSLFIFDIITRSLVAKWPKKGEKPDPRTFYSVAYHPDGKMLAVGEASRVSLWRLDTQPDPPAPTSGINPIETQPPQDSFPKSQLQLLEQYSPQNSAALGTSRGATGSGYDVLSEVAFDPSGQYLVWIGGDAYLNFWFFHRNVKTPIREHFSELSNGTDGPKAFFLKAHDEPTTQFSLSPSGTFVVTVSTDKVARFWEVKIPSEAELKSATDRLDPPVSYLCVGEGDALTMVGNDGKGRRVWGTDPNVASVLKQSGLQQPANLMLYAWTPDGNRTVFKGSNELVVIDLKNGKRFPSIPFDPAEVDVDATGKILAIQRQSGAPVELWDAEQGKALCTLGLENVVVGFGSLFAKQHPWLAFKIESGGLAIWDFTDAHHPKNLLPDIPPQKERGLNYLVFSPDDAHLGWISDSGTAYIWAINGHQLSATLSKDQINGELISDNLTRLQFSRDDTCVALGTSNGRIGLWHFEVKGSIPLFTQAHYGAVSALAFKADGTLISASQDRTVRLWKPDRDNLVGIGSLPGGAVDWRPRDLKETATWTGLWLDQPSVGSLPCVNASHNLGQMPSSLRDELDLAGFWRRAWSLLNSPSTTKGSELTALEASYGDALKPWLENSKTPPWISEAAHKILHGFGR